MGLAQKLHPDLQAKGNDNGIAVDPMHVADNQNHRARYFRLDPDHIRSLAKSMATSGQINPVQTRRADDNRLELVAGEHRHAAANLINDDEELRQLAEQNGNIHSKTGKFMLRVSVTNDNDEQAFLTALDENRRQKATSVIDDAHNQQRLRDEFGWDDDRIAAYYGVGKPWVQRTKKLLELNDDEARLVHEGKINVMDAMNLAALDEDARTEIISKAKTDSGDIDRNEMSEQTRQKRNETGRSLGRSVAQIRKDLQSVLDDEAADESFQAFCKDMMRYIKGKVGFEGGVRNALNRYSESAVRHALNHYAESVNETSEQSD